MSFELALERIQAVCLTGTVFPLHKFQLGTPFLVFLCVPPITSRVELPPTSQNLADTVAI